MTDSLGPKDNLVEKVMFSIDPGVKKDLPNIRNSGQVENLEILLSNKRNIYLFDLLNHGPVLLVFIRGTWCPFCRLYLGKLRKWADMLKGKNATIIVVSTETPEVISDWLDENPVNYLFASDHEVKLANYFGVVLPNHNNSQSVTFLIDTNKSIKMAYTGQRSSSKYSKVIESI